MPCNWWGLGTGHSSCFIQFIDLADWLTSWHSLFTVAVSELHCSFCYSCSIGVLTVLLINDRRHSVFVCDCYSLTKLPSHTALLAVYDDTKNSHIITHHTYWMCAWNRDRLCTDCVQLAHSLDCLAPVLSILHYLQNTFSKVVVLLDAPQRPQVQIRLPNWRTRYIQWNNQEMWQLGMHCNLRPPDPAVILIRFNYDTRAKFEVDQPIHCRFIAFFLLITVLISYVTLWPWPLTLWPWKFIIPRLCRDETL